MVVEPEMAVDEDQAGAPVRLTCGTCGATIRAEAGRVAHCPFCDSDQLRRAAPDADDPASVKVIPFALTASDASARYQRWLGSRVFRPHDLNRAAADRLQAVYVPARSFRGTARSNWASSDGSAGSEHVGHYGDLLISASRGLPGDWIIHVGGFDLARRQPATADLRRGRIEETPTPEADASRAAREQIAAKERDACTALDEAPLSGLQVTTNIADLTGALLLLPVWIASFHYQNQLYRCLINGQTGAEAGEPPVSGLKIALIFAAVVLAIIIVLAVTQLYGG